MPFPDSPRVIYRKNPLAEVICQLRFPAILRIAAELPAAFQERIRNSYPKYKQASSAPAVPTGLPAQVLATIQHVGSLGPASCVHEFSSDDDAWAATLAANFVALKTTDYRRWEEFHARLKDLLDALNSVYQPQNFERIGLRYVDVIQRSQLGLPDRPWRELLSAHIAAELAANGVGEKVQHVARQVHVRLINDHGQVVIRHGTVYVEPANEQCYIIDSDFFVEERVEKENALGILIQFNRKAGRLFRWCIQVPVHDALDPEAA